MRCPVMILVMNINLDYDATTYANVVDGVGQRDDERQDSWDVRRMMIRFKGRRDV